MQKSIPKNKEADHAVKFIQSLCLTEDYTGEPFRLQQWQEEFVRRLFGTLTADGERQYRKAFLFLSRKGGKTELAAALVIYCLFGLAHPGQEVVSAASNSEQSFRVFKAAKEMIEQDDYLYSLCEIVESKKEIRLPWKNCTFKSISGDPKKAGKSINFLIVDEGAEMSSTKGKQLVDILTSSMGARKNPLVLHISSAGLFDPEHWFYKEYQLACRIRDNPKLNPEYLPFIFEALEEKEGDWRDEKTWHKAMPGLSRNIPRLDFIRSEAKMAELSDSYRRVFCRYYLNRWVQDSHTFLDMDSWDRCPSKINIDTLKAQTAYGALDLSSTTDITAFVLLFEQNGIFIVLPFFWIPESKLSEQKDGIDYSDLVSKGIIRTCSGRTIDYDQVRQEIGEICKPYEIAMIACDSWGAHQISNGLFQDGFLVKYFRQGFVSMSAPTKELEKLILEKRINHGGNPVLRWMAKNTIVVTDPLNNLRPDKKKSTEKIDGIIALLMSLGVWLGEDHTPAVSWN